MKKKSVVVFLMLTSFFIQAQISIDKTIATVRLYKTEAITVSKLKERIPLLEKVNSIVITKEKRRDALDTLIDEIILNQAAEKEKLLIREADVMQYIKSILNQQVSDDMLKQAIEKQYGIRFDDYLSIMKNMLTKQKFVLEKKKNSVTGITIPTEKEIADFFETSRSKFYNPVMVCVDVITYDTRKMNDAEKKSALAEAEKYYVSIKNGDIKFEDLIFKAKMSGTTVKYTISEGDWLSREDVYTPKIFGENFFQVPFSLKSNEISKVVQSNLGIHILRIKERREFRLLTLDDLVTPKDKTTVRDYIKQNLYLQKQQTALEKAGQELLMELKKDADIKVFEENLAW